MGNAGSLIPSGTVSEEQPNVETPAPPRHGVIRRAAAGAWHLAAGYGFVFRNPSFWTLMSVPVVLTGLALACGVLAGAFTLPRIEGLIPLDNLDLPDWLDLGIQMGLWVGVTLAGMVVGLACALVITVPLLERLAMRVEKRIVPPGGCGLPARSWALLRPLPTALVLLLVTPAVLLLGLIPIAGPILGGLWGAYALGFQQLYNPLARRGLDPAARRLWLRRHQVEALGFGAAAVTILLAPGPNLVLAPLLAPALAIGSTVLVEEIEALGEAETDPGAEPPPPLPGPETD